MRKLPVRTLPYQFNLIVLELIARYYETQIKKSWLSTVDYSHFRPFCQKGRHFCSSVQPNELLVSRLRTGRLATLTCRMRSLSMRKISPNKGRPGWLNKL